MNVFAAGIILGIIGLMGGSFAGATLWRLRARQLRIDKKLGDKVTRVDERQVAKIKQQSVLKDRSVCLHCGHRLEWYDLVPLVSWLELGGKCRYCHHPIGKLEPIIEVLTAAVFVVSYAFWPLPLTDPISIVYFVIWLVACVGLIILSVYDFKWFLLPNPVVFTLIGIGIINSLIVLAQSQFTWPAILSVLVACGFLSGLYYLIYVFSQHQWVGFGDVKLGLALALLLADWEKAALALFLANAIGTVIFLPLMLSGKIKRQARIPFGPLLIAGWFFAGLFGTQIIGWYLHLVLGVS
jgi:prepilin signal peptidase PulO-like enzyme (type II secretory pathway)